MCVCSWCVGGLVATGFFFLRLLFFSSPFYCVTSICRGPRFNSFSLVLFAGSVFVSSFFLWLLRAVTCWVCAGPIRAPGGICPYRCNLHIPERAKPFTGFFLLSHHPLLCLPITAVLFFLCCCCCAAKRITRWVPPVRWCTAYRKVFTVQPFITRRSRPKFFLSTFKAVRLSS
jgi:hypothetical protein